MENVRLKLPNVDRVGLVLDISQTLAKRRINILSMEVEPNTTYLELEGMAEPVRLACGGGSAVHSAGFGCHPD